MRKLAENHFFTFMSCFIMLVIIMCPSLHVNAQKTHNMTKGLLEIYEGESKCLKTNLPYRIKTNPRVNKIVGIEIIGPNKILITGRKSGKVIINNENLKIGSVIAVKKLTLPGRKTDVAVYTGIENIDGSAANVEIEWFKMRGADGYMIYRETKKGEKEFIKKIDDENTITYIDPEVTVDNSCYYYVKGYKELGNGRTVYSQFGHSTIYE